MEDTDPAASVLLEDLDKAETSREIQEALDKYDLATQSWLPSALVSSKIRGGGSLEPHFFLWVEILEHLYRGFPGRLQIDNLG